MADPWIADYPRRDLRQVTCDLQRFEVATPPTVLVKRAGLEVAGAAQFSPEGAEEGPPGGAAVEAAAHIDEEVEALADATGPAEVVVVVAVVYHEISSVAAQSIDRPHQRPRLVDVG